MWRLMGLGLLVVTALALGGPAVPTWAGDLDRDALKVGMTLSEVVETFGQPVRMEWVNMKGQAVFVLFYESEDRDLLKLQAGPIGGDTIKGEDGRTVLPLGFVTGRLAGWGRKFYKQVKFPE